MERDTIKKRIDADLDPLEEPNREIKIMGDEFDEEEMEEEELKPLEHQDVAALTEQQRVLPNPEQIPEGMENAAREPGGEAEWDVNVEGENLG